MTNSFILWIQNDFKTHPVRFCLEFIAWALSVTCSLIMALTVPNPPLMLLYFMWIAGCAIFGWAAWSRQSFGMFGNYMLLMTIDIFGLMRMIIL
jgi:hypothetical protein